MVDKIEMSLDDIIKSSNSLRPRRGGAAGAGRGGVRRGALQRGRGSRQAALVQRPYRGGVIKGRGRGAVQKSNFPRGDVNGAWKNDLYGGGPSPKRFGGPGSNTAKLMISNLDYGVSESDIRELFADFGPLKNASVHYDRSGRSLGTADVTFERRGDAIKAIKQYDGVPLDGRPMNIQLATSDLPPLINRNRLNTGFPNKRRPYVAGGPSRGRGGIGPRRGGAGGRRGRDSAATAEELDAELDAYVKDTK